MDQHAHDAHSAPDAASPPDADPFGRARTMMVDGQVRPNKVTDSRILQAMRALPRERFLPPGLAGLAYLDQDVPLGGGRVLLQPMAIARLLQLARPRPGERALVVGAGAGYGAALLAACGADVVALEQDARLLAIAYAVLPRLAPRVRLVAGPLADGWTDGSPWDLVLIEGAVRQIPGAIAAQLRPGSGRVVTVLAPGPGGGCGVIALAAGAGEPLRPQAEFDCATPLLPPLAPAPSFTF